MITAANHKQHRSGQRRGGAAPRAASRAVHTSASRMDVQDRPGLRDRAGFFDASNSKATGGGFGRRTFSIPIARRCPLIGLSDRRAVLCLPAGQRATNFHTLPDQVPAKFADRLHSHSRSRLSSVSVFDAEDRDTGRVSLCKNSVPMSRK